MKELEDHEPEAEGFYWVRLGNGGPMTIASYTREQSWMFLGTFDLPIGFDEMVT